MLNVRLAGDHLYGKLLFTWLSLVMSMMVSFCAVLFPTRCLGWDLELNWVSFWGFSFLLLSFDFEARYGIWLYKFLIIAYLFTVCVFPFFLSSFNTATPSRGLRTGGLCRTTSMLKYTEKRTAKDDSVKKTTEFKSRLKQILSSHCHTELI